MSDAGSNTAYRSFGSVVSEEESDLQELARIIAAVRRPDSREVLQRFISERQANGVKLKTLKNEGKNIRDLCNHVPGPITGISRAEVVSFANKTTVEREWVTLQRDGRPVVTTKSWKLGPGTRAVRFGIVKGFLKWLRETTDDPPEVKGIRIKRPPPRSFEDHELITQDDLKRILLANPDPRMQALIYVLWETGVRSGEFRSFKVSSVRPSAAGIRLAMPDRATGLKTGPRTVLIIDSAPYLKNHLEKHAFRGNPDAPLFYNLSTRSYGKPLKSGSLNAMLKAAARRAGIQKRVWPHLARHSQTTERLRRGYPEALLKPLMGWTPRSNMVGRYGHVSMRDVEEFEMRVRGIVTDEAGKPAPLAPVPCPSCKTENLPTSAFCIRCGAIVDAKLAEHGQAQEEERMREQIARQVAKAMKEEIASEVRRAIESGGRDHL